MPAGAGRMTTLLPLDPAAFLARLGEIVAVWRAAFGAAAYADLDVETERRTAVMAGHAQRGGFRAVGAEDADGALVGIAYGCTGAAGHYWHDAVASLVDYSTVQRWLDHALEVCELHVQPGHQGCGIGRALLRALLEDAPQRRAVLSTWRGDTRARRLYDSLGFTVVVDDVEFVPGGHPYVVLGADLPLPSRRPAAGW